MVNSIIILEFLCIFSILIALLFTLNGDGAHAQKLMCFFLCGALVQNGAYLLELTASGPEAAIAAVKLENLGSLFVSLCYCRFLYAYCYEKPPRYLFQALTAVDFALLPLLLLCDRHQLIYRAWDWVQSGSFSYSYLRFEYGALYYPMMAVKIIVPYALSIYVLCRAIARRSGRDADRQYLAILLISLLPMLAMLAYVFKLTPVFDFAPIVLGFCTALVSIMLWTRRNYDFKRLASDVLLEKLGDGVVALDQWMRLVSFNPAAGSIFPDLNDRLVGESIRKLRNFRDQMLDPAAPFQFSIGERRFECHAQQIVDEDGRLQGYVMLILDITETVRHIEEIRHVRQLAEEASQAKSEFLTNMSHEIRTPMNAIIGMSEVIMEESRGRRLYGYAKDVQAAAQSLMTIINDILDLSKVEAGHLDLCPEDYNIKTLAGDIAAMMEMAASQQGLQFRLDLDPAIPCGYHGDGGRIKQVLINLLGNAVKFTKTGHIGLAVRGWPGKDEKTELLRFEVEDTGCGIRPEDQEKIFERFRQIDAGRSRSAEGVGLGLSIVKHLTQLLGGSISLQSVYGEGTTFIFELEQPITDSRPVSEAPEPECVQIEDFFSSPETRILVVDDNVVNRKVAAAFLQDYQFSLTEASSGQEAVELAKKHPYHLILMDHMMPGMDGVEAAKRIRRDCGENGKNAAIVALTANAMEGMRERFLANGFQDFIAKPLDRLALHELLLRWIPPGRRHEAPPWIANAQETDLASVRIPGIDMSSLLTGQVGSLNTFCELLELFRVEGREKPGRLRELVEAGDFKGYGVEVHGLKSAAANIGAMRLSAMALDHEKAAKSGNSVFIERHSEELITAYERQLGRIGEYLEKQRRADGGAERPPIEDGELLKTLHEALELLEDFRSRECGEKVDALLGRKLDSAVEARLREIHDRLTVYEDDDAEARLNQLIEKLEKEETQS